MRSTARPCPACYCCLASVPATELCAPDPERSRLSCLRLFSVAAVADNLDLDQGHRASSPDQAVEGASKNPTDDEITNNIRNRIAELKTSANLQELKVSTKDGEVTLDGLVKTAEEKQKVEAIAQFVAGDANVWSKLEVDQ